ncbi:MAG: methyltransferase domain-containing protein [Magnetococcales bacterium]|nr:methyltransferase domain-containing protein [Magnetococcales bacterium]
MRVLRVYFLTALHLHTRVVGVALEWGAVSTITDAGVVMRADVLVLKRELDKISRISNEDWVSSLDSRKIDELSFHDRDRDRQRIEALRRNEYEKFYGNKKFYKGSALSGNYVNKWMEENVKGKIFLDYACGNGNTAIRAAKLGAKLAIGLDISPISIENAKKDAEEEGVSKNTYFLQADAENTRFPDSSVECIVCSGMLHHLDLSYAFYELRRIMVPGAKLLAVEALGYNPFIIIYRNFTPQMRTKWEKEHILSLKDVRFAKQFFDLGEVRYWHITSIIAAYAEKLLPVLDGIDQVLTKVPLVQLLAWQFTFELIKKGEKVSRF